ncbi:Ger(x)C family spore germination protein [Virgibacillus sp. FSP13]
MRRKQGILLLLTILLTGCIQTKTIEDLGIINTRGVDLIEDNQLDTTLVIFKFDAKKQEVSKIVSGKGNTIKNARQHASYNTRFQLTPGAIDLEIYGKNAAKKGIMRYLDTLNRDARVSDTMSLAVSDTTAKEIIMSGEKSGIPNTGRYLHNLVKKNIKENVIPRVNLHDFVHFYFDKGRDPFLPSLGVKDGKPVLSSLAIFQDDRQVGQIPMKKAFYITMFNQTIKDLYIEIPLPLKPFTKYAYNMNKEELNSNHFYTLLTVLNGKNKTKITDVKNLEFQTKVDLEVSLLEMTEQISVKEQAAIKIMEKEIEKVIKHQYEKLLSDLQTLNADPFGYGSIYKANRPGGKLKRTEWRDKFPTIDVDFKVNVKILRHGMTP